MSLFSKNNTYLSLNPSDYLQNITNSASYLADQQTFEIQTPVDFWQNLNVAMLVFDSVIDTGNLDDTGIVSTSETENPADASIPITNDSEASLVSEVTLPEVVSSLEIVDANNFEVAVVNYDDMPTNTGNSGEAIDYVTDVSTESTITLNEAIVFDDSTDIASNSIGAIGGSGVVDNPNNATQSDPSLADSVISAGMSESPVFVETQNIDMDTNYMVVQDNSEKPTTSDSEASLAAEVTVAGDDLLSVIANDMNANSVENTVTGYNEVGSNTGSNIEVVDNLGDAAIESIITSDEASVIGTDTVSNSVGAIDNPGIIDGVNNEIQVDQSLTNHVISNEMIENSLYVDGIINMNNIRELTESPDIPTISSNGDAINHIGSGLIGCSNEPVAIFDDRINDPLTDAPDPANITGYTDSTLIIDTISHTFTLTGSTVTATNIADFISFNPDAAGVTSQNKIIVTSELSTDAGISISGFISFDPNVAEVTSQIILNGQLSVADWRVGESAKGGTMINDSVFFTSTDIPELKPASDNSDNPLSSPNTDQPILETLPGNNSDASSSVIQTIDTNPSVELVGNAGDVHAENWIA